MGTCSGDSDYAAANAASACCSVEPAKTTCTNAGTRGAMNIGICCTCKADRMGEACVHQHDPCKTNPCQNSGVCEYWGATCTHPAGTVDPLCTIVGGGNDTKAECIVINATAGSGAKCIWSPFAKLSGGKRHKDTKAPIGL